VKKNEHTISRYSLSGKLLETYPSAKAAAQALNGLHQHISAAASDSKRAYTAYGYLWRRGDDEDIDIQPLLKEKWFGPSPLSSQQHTVGQYDLDGNLIRTHLNSKEAAKFVGVHYNGIRDVIKGRGLTYGGFVWSKVIKKKIKVNPQIAANNRIISQYDLNGRWIRSFKSGLEATKETGIDNGAISNSIKGVTLSAGGYLWRKGQQLRININELRRHPHFESSRLQRHMKAKKSGVAQTTIKRSQMAESEQD
jgi:hypothetical protein